MYESIEQKIQAEIDRYRQLKEEVARMEDGSATRTYMLYAEREFQSRVCLSLVQSRPYEAR